ncbi:cyclin-A3-1-like [Nymphaea colorata]|nr:cyclin-A3-1-like [Nymphaea colorata]
MSCDQENRAPVTRARAKRAADSSAATVPPQKKRAALAELTNLIDASSSAPARSRRKSTKAFAGVDLGGKPQTSGAASRQKKRVVLGELPELARSSSGAAGRTRRKAGKSRTRDDNADPLDDDPQMCRPYASDIYEFLRSSEVKRRPSSNYMESVQNDITANMRSILVDWLVEVAEEYKLVADTLYLTISYVDRFLSANALNRQKLQLLGVSCMLIASKYEEISPPHVEDFCYITDNTYTKEELVEMESKILTFFKFELSNPTIKTFLRRFVMAAEGNNKSPNLLLEFLCNFLAELSLLEYGCLEFLPSQIAASILFVARFIINPKTHPWTMVLQNDTGYKPSELKDCAHIIHDLQLNKRQSTLLAVREKYNQHKFKCVSTLNSPEEIPSSFFEDLK